MVEVVETLLITNAGACDDVQSAIVTLTDIVTAQVAAGNLTGLPAETSYIAGPWRREMS